MTINRTTLLDLPLPVTGTESGTWGDVTNNGLTEYLDIAIAGMVSLTSSDFTAGALTISTTEGNSSGTNIANSSAQYATLKASSLAANSTITAPASARAYRVINADATYTLTVKASGQTGVTFQPGTTGMVAFNGTDYEIVGVVGPASATDNAVARFDGTTGQIVQNSGVTIDDSNNVSGVAQLNATTADLTNIEVTNLKAKDGTAAGSIADSTGVVTITSLSSTTGNITTVNATTVDTTSIEVTNIKAKDSTAAMSIADSTGAVSILNTGVGAKFTSSAGNGLRVYGASGTNQWDVYLNSTNIRFSDNTGGGKLVVDTDATISGLTVGKGAGAVSTNTAVGSDALINNTTGSQNTAVGYQAGYVITTGSQNTAFGASIMDQSVGVTGSENAAFGRVNMRALTSGSYNTATGNAALNSLTTGSNNTASGYQALASNTTASHNTAVGYQVGYSNTTGAHNSFFGGIDPNGIATGYNNTTGSNNAAFGAGAMRANTTGSNNAAFGHQALLLNTTGGAHTAVGYQALFSTTTTARNTAVGFQAAYNTTTGAGICAIGSTALYSNTTGQSNTAVGSWDNTDGQLGPLYYNTTGRNNIAIGTAALANNTTASNNTAVGYQAGYSNTTGTGLVAVGEGALYANTTGSYGVAVGQDAATANTTGQPVAIGAVSLSAQTTPAGNTAVGHNSAQNTTTGDNNTAIGRYALTANTTANNNTAVGYQAGYSNTTGATGVYFGRQAGYSNTASSQNTFIGDQAAYYTTGATNTFVGFQSGVNVTTGSKNTILGSYNGNQGGLDIRTSSNYIVLSDGDGNPLVATADNKTLSLEGAVPQSGTGITFPATQSASSDANTLDDYERGSWTPGLAGSSTPGTFSLSVATGSYTKIGNMVTLYAAITVSSVSGSPSGNLQITGLPFGCAAGTSASGAIQASKLGQTAIQGVSFSTRGASSVLYVTYIDGSFDAQVIQASAPGNGTIIDFCISYPQS
jgi:hypothetical protein